MPHQALLALLQLSAMQIQAPLDWRWDPKSPICTLRQELTAGNYIEIKRTPANDETELTMSLSPESKASDGRFRDGAINLYPSGHFARDIHVGAGRDGERVFYVIASDPSFFEQLGGAVELGVSHPKITSPPVTLRNPHGAITALQSCEDRLMRSWGIDPAAWRGLKSRPISIGQVRDRFSALDYPTAAVIQHVETDAIMRLDIGVDGKVSQCRMLSAGKAFGFEEASCRVLKRARFQPARDISGAAVPAPVIYDVVFRLAN